MNYGGEYVVPPAGEFVKSVVENNALVRSGRSESYDGEIIKVIEVENFPILGKLVALRFLEWVQQNEGGVISLPTGRTPEHFIKWVKFFLKHWDDEKTQNEMQAMGLNPSQGRPNMQSLHFVQIDEFYPINSANKNTFFQYVREHYIAGFELDPSKAMLIDTWTLGCPAGKTAGDLFCNGIDESLRWRAAKTELEIEQKTALAAVDAFCTDYEDRIKALGGIGFFLGGIGPDGHVAFNCRGSDLHSTTRLTPVNYETQAAASTDLGGIEVARKSWVITIGMGTITSNPAGVALVFAAGDAKAKVVADSIQLPRSNLRPAGALADLPNARFYLTRSAATGLAARVLEDVREEAAKSAAGARGKSDMAKKVVMDLGVRLKKRLRDITAEDVHADALACALFTGCSAAVIKGALLEAEQSLLSKLEHGSTPRTVICPPFK
ncbi:hypothetical protein CYMTET_32965 [Cymbomonas tetramitiformis]|uniref:Glucosamine-6-phosphate deaminase n=1 Tax=Cymbomonas tetramitiformis TaxID=36881 RepID=A0AAE0FDR6_9CHLO|nr:hypothetical protein CYMTET_32965 [Cymbomonas tetramitiformis]